VRRLHCCRSLALAVVSSNTLSRAVAHQVKRACCAPAALSQITRSTRCVYLVRRLFEIGVARSRINDDDACNAEWSSGARGILKINRGAVGRGESHLRRGKIVHDGCSLMCLTGYQERLFWTPLPYDRTEDWRFGTTTKVTRMMYSAG